MREDEKNVRFGVVGLGMGMGRSQMIAGTDGAELVAVSDLREEKRTEAEEKFGCRSYVDYQEMLACEELDVVQVMTPTGLHAEVGIAAAEAGKHVITTKPMETTVEKCDSLIRACKQAGVKLMVDYGERYAGVNRRIKRALEMGALGTPIAIEVRMKWFRDEDYYSKAGPPVGWHGTWQYDGGGSVMNQGIHQIDLMQWFMGPVERVFGHYGVYNHENVETEDLAAAVVQFKNGAMGSIFTTTTCPAHKVTMVQIHGSRGVVGKGPEVWDFVEGEPQIELEPYPANIAEDVVQVLKEGTSPAVDGHEGRKSVEIIEAIYRSSRQDCWIDLPLE